MGFLSFTYFLVTKRNKILARQTAKGRGASALGGFPDNRASGVAEGSYGERLKKISW
jgi:hypothetical protein